MLINPIAREIVIDGDDCVEHAASPFFLPYSSHVTYFQSPGVSFVEVGVMLNSPMN